MILKNPIDLKSYRKKIYFTKNARTAWRLALQAEIKRKKRTLKILLPSYIGITEREGSGIFDPIASLGLDFNFYKLSRKLEIDITDFRNKLSADNFDCVLIVHYFGLCMNDMREVSEICKEFNVVLIEDCAHLFCLNSSSSKIGNYGDYSFFSLHKFLPTNEGGALLINSEYNNDIDFDHLTIEDQINKHDLSYYCQADLDNIVKVRKNNFNLYQKKLESVKGIEFFGKFNEDDIPQTFPIIINGGLREKLYFHLMNKQMPTIALYYRMIPQLDPNIYPNSFELSTSIINLPTHQDTTNEDIKILCDEISVFMQNNFNC